MTRVGPWRGEVGYELLYWIPWITKRVWLCSHPVVISRGGVGAWYQHLPVEYHNLDTIPAGPIKQLSEMCDPPLVAPFTNSIHPSEMFKQMKAIRLSKSVEVGAAFDLLDYRVFTPIEKPIGLPERYIATRIYQSDMMSKASFERCQAYIDRLAQEYGLPVVDLQGPQMDDHRPYPVNADMTVSYGDDVLNNLGVQTRVFAHADAVVATYGGMSYLPTFYRVPVYALYDGPVKRPANVTLIRDVARRFGTSFTFDAI